MQTSAGLATRPQPELHPNYRFMLEFAKATAGGRPIRVLDYGCGSGRLVTAARDQGLDFSGVEAFYEGGDTRSQISAELLGSVIRELDGDRIPFPDQTFDLVVNNQVLEHVVDLDVVLDEIARVLKPAGVLLSMFPSKDVWREGHCGIPFLHRFAPTSRTRVTYARTMRRIGFGYHTTGKTADEWARSFVDWLDRFTVYRTRREIARSFDRYFSTRHEEASYMAFRLRARGRVTLARITCAAPSNRATTLACRKLIGLVMVSTLRSRSAEVQPRTVIEREPRSSRN